LGVVLQHQLRDDGRAELDQFVELVKLGAKTMPLVVDKLAASKRNFPGVYLYNKIETNKDFRVGPKDDLNFRVLQRQAHLIVDMNLERK
jgi:hypothetical protein